MTEYVQTVRNLENLNIFLYKIDIDRGIEESEVEGEEEEEADWKSELPV